MIAAGIIIGTFGGTFLVLAAIGGWVRYLLEGFFLAACVATIIALTFVLTGCQTGSVLIPVPDWNQTADRLDCAE